MLKNCVLKPDVNTDFKTSHVIVYPTDFVLSNDNIGISKHLMLLFISFFSSAVADHLFISKHLMLLFIELTIMHKGWQEQISKHLMLLFIQYNLYVLLVF